MAGDQSKRRRLHGNHPMATNRWQPPDGNRAGTTNRLGRHDFFSRLRYATAMTPLQIQTAKAILRLFETGTPLPQYAAITADPGEHGGLIYGASDATLRDGSLGRIVKAYESHDRARHGKPFQLFRTTLRDRNPALTTDRYFQNLLRAAADDPAMAEIQEDAWEAQGWTRAMAEAERRGLTTALGRAVVADSLRHGSWEGVRRRTVKAHDTIQDLGESRWLAAYVEERRAWLLAHRRKIMGKDAWRMAVFAELIRLGNWDLRLPIVIRGVELSPALFKRPGADVYSGPMPGSRVLELTSPLMRGQDVRIVQLALSALSVGRDVVADGIYGPQTVEAVRLLQDTMSYPVTGTVGPTELDMLDF